MTEARMPGLRPLLVWALIAGALALPVIAAARSPLLAYREPVYVAAGLAGVAALALLLLQPLLAGGVVPGMAGGRGRRLHRLVGAVLVAAVVLHVGALWLTSPPDVVDALLFRSPTPFSVWGVVAMWAVFAAALVAALRRRLGPAVWRIAHRALAAVVVVGTVIHALLIDGTMETVTKIGLCLLVLAAAARVLADRRGWPVRRRGDG
jgi:predicted ferric reductase